MERRLSIPSRTVNPAESEIITSRVVTEFL
jgi:hypothetical protein